MSVTIKVVKYYNDRMNIWYKVTENDRYLECFDEEEKAVKFAEELAAKLKLFNDVRPADEEILTITI